MNIFTIPQFYNVDKRIDSSNINSDSNSNGDRNSNDNADSTKATTLSDSIIKKLHESTLETYRGYQEDPINEINSEKRLEKLCTTMHDQTKNSEDMTLNQRLLSENPFSIIESSPCGTVQYRKPFIKRLNMDLNFTAKKYADKLWERCNVLFDSEWVSSVKYGSIFTQIDYVDGNPTIMKEPLEITWVSPLHPSMAFDHLKLSIVRVR